MDEYKRCIRGEISKLPVNASQSGTSFSVYISEAGLEAMKKDPEYEEYVLGALRKDFNTYDPWSTVCGSGYAIYNIEATKAQCSARAWYAAYDNGRGADLYRQKSPDSFWERIVTV